MSEEREQKAGRLVNEESDVEAHAKSGRQVDESTPTDDIEANVEGGRQVDEESADNS
jgi:hypothetical protein